jgi:hypothetical protein
LTPTRKTRARGSAEQAGPLSPDYEAGVALGELNMLVPWYLMASYAYYVLDQSLLTDAQFDRMCSLLYQNWDMIDHRHKAWVDRDALRAGTGYHMAERDYPSMAVSAAHRLIGLR